MAEVTAARLSEALDETEAALAALRESLAARQSALDDEERRAIRMEQLIAALRSRLDALPGSHEEAATP